MLRSIKKDAVIGVQALQTDSFLVEGVNDFAGYLNSFQIDVQTTSSNGQLRHYLDERLGKKKKNSPLRNIPPLPPFILSIIPPLPYRTRPWRIQFCARNSTELKRTRNFVRWFFTTSLEISFFYSWLFFEWYKIACNDSSARVLFSFTRMIIIIITKRVNVNL